MRSTRIVTSFVRCGGRILLLRRSGRARTMGGLWAGVSGIIEGDEEPLHRAVTEIYEEAGIPPGRVTLVRAAPEMRVDSPQYRDHEWVVCPFLFETDGTGVTLNWENSEYRWILPSELGRYDTVPSLGRVLACLL